MGELLGEKGKVCGGITGEGVKYVRELLGGGG